MAELSNMKRIEKPEARLRFWELMKATDSKVVHQTYLRRVTTKDGELVTKEYLMKPQELERTKIERVFTTALNWYVDHYNNMIKTMPEGSYDYNDVESLPMLLTTSQNLGNSAGCSDRTARTMLKKMEELGVMKRVNKGSKMGIGITFTPTFLWGETAEERAEKLASNLV